MTLSVLSPKVITSRLLMVVLATMAAGIGTTEAISPSRLECGAIITEDTVLVNDVGPCAGDGLLVIADNITLNLNGHKIFSKYDHLPYYGAGVHLFRVAGVTVKGGTISGFHYGVFIDSGSHNTIKHVNAIGNVDGISITGSPSDGHVVEDNVATANSLGIVLRGGVTNSLIVSNRVKQNSHGIVIASGGFPRRSTTSVGPALFELTSPDRALYVEGIDYRVMPGSGSGDVTGRLVPIDISLSGAASAEDNPIPADGSSSGCENADFEAAGFQPGDIALIQRGTCTFNEKIDMAWAKGASAVVLFNEGQDPARTSSAFGAYHLSELDIAAPVPVLSAAYSVGYMLYNLTRAGPVTVRLVATTVPSQETVPITRNNVLLKNFGQANTSVDAFDGNGTCEYNSWVANRFRTVYPGCIDPDATPYDPSDPSGGGPPNTGAIVFDY